MWRGSCENSGRSAMVISPGAEHALGDTAMGPRGVRWGHFDRGQIAPRSISRVSWAYVSTFWSTCRELDGSLTDRYLGRE
jgi:hypothetical protein